MKVKTLLKILAPALLMISGAANATIAGSFHDLSAAATDNDPALGLTLKNICIYCHTPHNSVVGAAPLWNRNDSLETFDMYDQNNSTTLGMTVALVPDPFSAACLSCHDGVTALDSMVNTPYGYVTAATNNVTTWGSLSNDLTNDHPISIEYDVSKDAAFVAIGTGAVGGLPLFPGTATAGTTANQVECASCHDVHDQTTYFPFLRMSNDGSALCLNCHVK